MAGLLRHRSKAKTRKMRTSVRNYPSVNAVPDWYRGKVGGLLAKDVVRTKQQADTQAANARKYNHDAKIVHVKIAKKPAYVVYVG